MRRYGLIAVKPFGNMLAAASSSTLGRITTSSPGRQFAGVPICTHQTVMRRRQRYLTAVCKAVRREQAVQLKLALCLAASCRESKQRRISLKLRPETQVEHMREEAWMHCTALAQSTVPVVVGYIMDSCSTPSGSTKCTPRTVNLPPPVPSADG